MSYNSDLAMLLPLPFRRGEGRGDGSLRVVHPTVPSVRESNSQNEPQSKMDPMKTIIRSFLITTGLSLLTLGTQAQTYSIDWDVIAGGGGTSTGGVYSVSSTIGQHVAGGSLSGGGYSLAAGFWALYAVATPGAPTLSIFSLDP